MEIRGEYGISYSRFSWRFENTLYQAVISPVVESETREFQGYCIVEYA